MCSLTLIINKNFRNVNRTRNKCSKDVLRCPIMSCDVRFSAYLYGIIYILGLLFCAFLIYNKGVFKLEMTERLGVLTERSFTMNFLKNISAAFKTAGGAVQGAVKVVEEKNRRTALMNRLRTVIRCEERQRSAPISLSAATTTTTCAMQRTPLRSRTASTLKPPRSASMPLWRSWKP